MIDSSFTALWWPSHPLLWRNGVFQRRDITYLSCWACSEFTSTEISGPLPHSQRNRKICRKATYYGLNSPSLHWRLLSSHYLFLVNMCQSIQRYKNTSNPSPQALINFEYVGSNARAKSRTDMFTLCFIILFISGPGHNAWLPRSTFAIRSTSSSFGFGLLSTHYEACLSGKS